MKKLISVIICGVVLLLSISPSYAYNMENDIEESFIPYNNTIYITKETKAGDIRYFGERITFYDSHGKELSADDYLKTGDTLVYFDIVNVYRIVLIGDCNFDGKITPADARLALRIAANLCSYSEKSATYGAWDANFSQTPEPSDAREILRVAAKIDSFEKFKTVYNEVIEKTNNQTAEYDDKMIMICLNPAYVNNEDVYKPEFYGELVDSVEIFAEYSDNHIWLELHLAEPSKENIDILINECYANDAVIIAERNGILTID